MLLIHMIITKRVTVSKKDSKELKYTVKYLTQNKAVMRNRGRDKTVRNFLTSGYRKF